MSDKYVWSQEDVTIEDELQDGVEELDAPTASEEEMLSWFTPGAWEGIVYEDDETA